MAVGERTSTQGPLELIHPVYLDVPMMVSFYAAIEGGVSFSGEFTGRVKASVAREREGQGRAGLPSITSLFGLSLDMSGRMKRASQDEESTEMKVVREHTEASLFNLLRESLRSRDDFIEIVDVSQLAQVNAGQLVEISGEILGNPLQQILDAFGKFCRTWVLIQIWREPHLIPQVEARGGSGREANPGKVHRLQHLKAPKNQKASARLTSN